MFGGSGLAGAASDSRGTSRLVLADVSAELGFNGLCSRLDGCCGEAACLEESLAGHGELLPGRKRSLFFGTAPRLTIRSCPRPGRAAFVEEKLLEVARFRDAGASDNACSLGGVGMVKEEIGNKSFLRWFTTSSSE